ncbi:MAG: hypothetical protein HFJ33_00965 [Clostridia bacterium]|nr:hypothetical protein [Clostridia bacterium]
MKRIQVVKENDKYCFKIFPRNSNTQALGKSPYFKEEGECTKALREFMQFIINNGIKTSDSKYVKTKDDGTYQIINDEKIKLFTSIIPHKPAIEYNLKQEFDTTINSIYNNVILEMY